jgi:hypothetical protein
MTMRLQRLFWLLAGAGAAVLYAACAPVGNGPPPGPVGPRAEVGEDGFQAPPPKIEPLEKVALQPRDILRERVEEAIKNVRERDLLTTHGFWTVFHGLLGLGPGLTLKDPVTGQRHNALDYICQGGEIRGMRFIPTEHGLEVQTGPQFVGQGHQDQFIAELAQWGMPADRKFRVNGKDYTFMDFVRHAQMRSGLKANQELGWSIVVVAQYVGTEAAWANAAGEKVRLTDMLRYELEAPMDKAACGGTHRLFDLAWVRNLHLLKGGKDEGVWKDVAENTVKYQKLAKKLQNPDGSFSTDFFRGPANAGDMQQRIYTSGHTFEFLAYTLPDAQLREGWVQDGANAVAQLILAIQGAPMEGGALYHATHGLVIYHARVYDRSELGRGGLILPLPPAAAATQSMARSH